MDRFESGKQMGGDWRRKPKLPTGNCGKMCLQSYIGSVIDFRFFGVRPTRESREMKELTTSLTLARTWHRLSSTNPLQVRPEP